MFFNHKGKYTVENLGKRLTVSVSLLAYQKMMYYTKECNTEVGWMGKVTKEGNTYKVHDVYLVSQEAHGTTCELSPEALVDLSTELLMKDEDTEAIKLWGHSHVNMGTSPSGQDCNTLIDFLNEGNDWFMGVITNKKGEMTFSLYDKCKLLAISDLDYELDIANLINEKEIKEEIKQKVTKKEVQVQVINRGSYWDRYENYGYENYGYPYGNNKKNEKEIKKEDTNSPNDIYALTYEILTDLYSCNNITFIEQMNETISKRANSHDDVDKFSDEDWVRIDFLASMSLKSREDKVEFLEAWFDFNDVFHVE